MKEYHHSNCHLLDQINEKIDLHEKDAEELEKEGPTLAERFRFYQELRGYVTDLVECLDEKVGSYMFGLLWCQQHGIEQEICCS